MARIRKSQDFQKHPLPKSPRIYIENHQKALPIRKRFFYKSIRELFSFLQISCEEISVYFVSEKKISSLHDQFFQDPSPTDCITFPLLEAPSGEIFVCPSVAISYAKKREINPLKETLLYVVHGVLHLLGFDDLDATSRKAMRKMEKKCMDHLESVFKTFEYIPGPPQGHPFSKRIFD